jgi:hypothetical protein
MLHEAMIEYKVIAKSRHEKIDENPANENYHVDGQSLPPPVVFFDPGWVDVRSEEITIEELQH